MDDERWTNYDIPLERGQSMEGFPRTVPYLTGSFDSAPLDTKTLSSSLCSGRHGCRCSPCGVFDYRAGTCFVLRRKFKNYFVRAGRTWP